MKNSLLCSKYLLFTVGCIVLMTSATGQRLVPASYTGSTYRSYVRTWTADAPEQSASIFITRPLKDVKQSTQYFDALGRPLQSVLKQGSYPTNGTAVDMVDMVEYDAFGREQFKYLSTPSTAVDATKNDGNFKLNPFAQQSTFMISQYKSTQDEDFYYGQTVFEASPLNRVQESVAPGDNWMGSVHLQPNEALHHAVKMKYYVNTATDAVRIWNVTTGSLGSFSTYVSPGAYTAGLLLKTITVDEQNKQIIEFEDKDGRVILKKVQLTATADDGISGRDHTGWLCTYYIYDDLNNLHCVIQPQGVEAISATWVLTDPTIIAEQCFRYEYDQRNRMIIKKVPGANEVYMVYDARDRLVMTQDGNLRTAGKWMVTLYESQNRPEVTGLLLNIWNGNSFTAHLTAAAGSSIYPFTTASPASVTYWEELTKTFYDNYDWVAANGNIFSINRSNGNDPQFVAPSNTVFPYPQPLTQSFAVNGMVTGTKTKVLGSSQYLWDINFYDLKGRILQSLGYNFTGGVKSLETQYDFAGKPLIQFLVELSILGVGRHVYLKSVFEYDDLGRLLLIKKTPLAYDNVAWTGGTESVIVNNEYDALGQLKKKKLAPAYNSNAGLQAQVYDYNIRGWLLGVNRSEIAANGISTNYFGFDLGYDKIANATGRNYTTGLFNGNINGMVWKSNGDGIRRKYDFSYDAANRLMQGLFEQNDAGSTWGASLVNYTIKMGDGVTPASAYYSNGNIKQMQQWGLKLTGSGPIDNLTYTYNTNSNKLKNVLDGNNDSQTKLGDFRVSALYMTALGTKTNAAIDYIYDDNGNMIKDRNKDIGDGSNNGIVYNHLNLPQTITIRTTAGAVKGTITYTYDAAGNKLRKVTLENGASVNGNATTITTTTNYLGISVDESKLYGNAALMSLQYSNKLQFIAQEEGRIRFTGAVGATPAKFSYDYFIKDHLGNTRMVLTDELQTDMYPAATMELATATTEQAYYTNLPATRVTTLPPGYPANTPAGNAAVAKVNGAGNKIGPAIILKVMSGDKFNLAVNSWWSSGNTTFPVNSVATDLGTALANGLAGLSGKVSSGDLVLSGLTSSDASDFLGSQLPPATTKPKAYINWILLDEQFKIVRDGSGNVTGSGSDQVGATGIYTPHTKTNMPVTKNGYLYIYVSNETTNTDVFFDNLQVTHIRGPILEETHYYPFGLTMAGVSSKAVKTNYAENKINKFQNQEFNGDFDINTYEFRWRTADPQIGKFWQVDPLADKYRYNSLYAFSENKVIAHRELEGLEAWTVNNSDGTTAIFSGPWANQNAAQLAYNNRKRIDGERLNIGTDGMVVSTRIVQDRQVQENGPLSNVIGIVLHRTAGSSVSGALDGMKSENLGVHFIIDKDGTIMQLASLNFWTSHVGSPLHKDWAFRSTNTIGIEHVGAWHEDSKTWDELTEEQIDASAWLVKSLMKSYNIHPYDVRNHEDLRDKKPNEGAMIRNVIASYLYRLDAELNSDQSDPYPARRCPLYY